MAIGTAPVIPTSGAAAATTKKTMPATPRRFLASCGSSAGGAARCGSDLLTWLMRCASRRVSGRPRLGGPHGVRGHRQAVWVRTIGLPGPPAKSRTVGLVTTRRVVDHGPRRPYVWTQTISEDAHAARRTAPDPRRGRGGADRRTPLD